jgi:ribosomal protein L7/L12
MPKCPFCEHFNRTGAAQCEECGAQLQDAADSDAASTPPPAAPDAGSLEADVLALMQGNKKIQAIKLYRERTGVGLKEAKDFVEALAANHGVAPSSGGCAGMVLLMLLAGATVAGAAWSLAAV